ncbi:rhodanese-like domain-containing protein [Aeoliella sp.]|uniref:rhodanese-like domain-containing protein n=1 Tax=Aeoliella sp. TaxID=2795800 RepID=UPI003CCC0A14
MQKLTAAQLDQAKQQGKRFLLVNTLDEAHFDKTNIEGAVNIPQQDDDFVERVEKQAGGKDQPVVVYCANTECSSSTQAAEKLEKAGFTNVYDFESGAEGWKESGHRTVGV